MFDHQTKLPCVQEGRAAPAVPPHTHTRLLLWPHEWMDTEEMHTNPSQGNTKGSTPTKEFVKILLAEEEEVEPTYPFVILHVRARGKDVFTLTGCEGRPC